MALPLAVPIAIGAAGLIGSLYENDTKSRDTRNSYEAIRKMADQVAQQNQADIAGYKGMLDSTYGAGAAKYSQALQDFLNSPVYQNSDFSFDGNINDYYDPAANQRMEAAQAALERAGADGGNRFSSDYTQRSMAAAAAQSSEEWAKAYERLMQARQQQLSEWQANSQNGWNNYGANQDRLQAAVNAYGADRNALTQGYGDVTMAGMNNRTANLQSQASTIGAMQSSLNQRPGALGTIANAGATFLGNYFGGK